MQPDVNRFEVQRQCSFIADGFLKGVATHIALFILISPECPEGITVSLIDRCSRQTEEKSIGESLAHPAPEVAFLSAVSLIHHDNDVGAVIEQSAGFSELMDGGNDDLSDVPAEELLKFLPAIGPDHIGNIGGVEGGGDLSIEVDPIDNDYHRRIF